jgi:hypothetical protein
MHIDPVEIYSDASNAAVMRHPGRRFPACLFKATRYPAFAQRQT